MFKGISMETRKKVFKFKKRKIFKIYRNSLKNYSGITFWNFSDMIPWNSFKWKIPLNYVKLDFSLIYYIKLCKNFLKLHEKICSIFSIL